MLCPDKTANPKENDLTYATDFVKFIKEEHDDHFVISVAGESICIFGLAFLFFFCLFNGSSTFMGYLMPKLSL